MCVWGAGGATNTGSCKYAIFINKPSTVYNRFSDCLCQISYPILVLHYISHQVSYSLSFLHLLVVFYILQDCF